MPLCDNKTPSHQPAFLTMKERQARTARDKFGSENLQQDVWYRPGRSVIGSSKFALPKTVVTKY